MSQLNSKIHTSPDQLIFSWLKKAMRDLGRLHSKGPRRPLATGVVGRGDGLTSDGVGQPENQMMKVVGSTQAIREIFPVFVCFNNRWRQLLQMFSIEPPLQACGKTGGRGTASLFWL